MAEWGQAHPLWVESVAAAAVRLPSDSSSVRRNGIGAYAHRAMSILDDLNAGKSVVHNYRKIICRATDEELTVAYLPNRQVHKPRILRVDGGLVVSSRDRTSTQEPFRQLDLLQVMSMHPLPGE